MQIDKNICLVCLKEIKEKGIRFLLEKKVYVCQECLNKMAPKIKKITINDIHGYGFYEYNSEIQSLIYKYKGAYDVSLSNVFLNHFTNFIKLLYFDFVFVPVPSYAKADEKRGFNHVIEIAKSLNVKIIDCLIKTSDVKQANLNNKKRKEIKNYIALKDDEKEKLKNKKVVIFDDILTTGSTMKACLELIKQCEVKEIKFMIVAYTRR